MQTARQFYGSTPYCSVINSPRGPRTPKVPRYLLRPYYYYYLGSTCTPYFVLAIESHYIRYTPLTASLRLSALICAWQDDL